MDEFKREGGVWLVAVLVFVLLALIVGHCQGWIPAS